MGVIVLVHFNKIIYLPAPLLCYVFDRSVLLHKIPNICRFYPYFSMLFRFSIAICQLFILLTVRPLNQNTTDAQRKPKKEWVGITFRLLGNDQLNQSGCWKYNGNCILKSCFPRKNKITLPSREARKCEFASYIIFSPLKLSPQLTRFFDRSCRRTRRRRPPKWILLTFYLCSVL